MARRPRIVLPGVAMHLIQRGNNRSITFRSTQDFERYLNLLHDASRRFRCAIHAYVLMPNHVHLLITPEDESGPSLMMQTVGRPYVRYVNTRHHRTGGLWEGRFRSSIVQSDRYLLTCSRYIELNPVRARIVDEPDGYRWSSYCHNAYGTADQLVTQHSLYDALGASALECRAAYRALFDDPMEQQTIDRIRGSARRGTALGDTAFCERVEAARRARGFQGSDAGVRSSHLTPGSDPGI